MSQGNGIAITHSLPRLCSTKRGVASERTICARYMTKRVVGLKSRGCWLKRSKSPSLPGTLRARLTSSNASLDLRATLMSCTHYCAGLSNCQKSYFSSTRRFVCLMQALSCSPWIEATRRRGRLLRCRLSWLNAAGEPRATCPNLAKRWHSAPRWHGGREIFPRHSLLPGRRTSCQPSRERCGVEPVHSSWE